ncbi:hypothetical protein [Pyrinomonas methylaliphatogenes]|jgi:hypothetical protein|uniref:Uncharacterized protein n=1 Tax=Pyrinomonas methylaliphatogenes TaxID=454194 RepID=A0A0B6X1G1_9BACT|nr:hypothetical protein [Pyrinomonas methylaliphatogenes]MBX5479744.1 hypothetical protein [Pyrinomonas methylaliphatogenes]CDM66404.1 hypothetical protein PYK22_02434 [Pyrinomonas methylaliphatogenes]
MMERTKNNLEYLKEALREPANFWGLAGFAIAAAYTQSLIPLIAALISELLYLSTVPTSSVYRRLVDRRRRREALEERRRQRQRLIESFDPREREAVNYLNYVKEQIYKDYKRLTGAREIPSNLKSLDQRWEDFVDLLDVYRRRKKHLRSINRQVIQNQLKQAERAVEEAADERERRIQQANVAILRRRLAAFDELERSVKLVEGQLQSIENFFGLVKDQVVALPTPERVSMIDFEQLSDSIAMTKQMLEETSEAIGALDAQNRALGNYDLLTPGTSSR